MVSKKYLWGMFSALRSAVPCMLVNLPAPGARTLPGSFCGKGYSPLPVLLCLVRPAAFLPRWRAHCLALFAAREASLFPFCRALHARQPSCPGGGTARPALRAGRCLRGHRGQRARLANLPLYLQDGIYRHLRSILIEVGLQDDIFRLFPFG